MEIGGVDDVPEVAKRRSVRDPGYHRSEEVAPSEGGSGVWPLRDLACLVQLDREEDGTERPGSRDQETIIRADEH